MAFFVGPALVAADEALALLLPELVVDKEVFFLALTLDVGGKIVKPRRSASSLK